MPKGDGVTYQDKGGGKWRLRWRERKPDGGWRSKEMMIQGNEIDRDRLVVEIRDALRSNGTFSRDLAPASARAPANLLVGLMACIDARVAGGKYAEKTAYTYRCYATRVLSSAHRVLRIPETEPLPVTVLSRDLFVQIQVLDQQRSSSPMMRYAPLRLLLDAWRWMADDPARWAQVPEPPRSPRDFLPRTPSYGRTIAPSLEHIDACIRHLPAKVDQGTRVAALLMRYTGLRSGQVFSIRRADVDLESQQLYVRGGRTRREKDDARTVPLAGHLLAEPGVLGWIDSFFGEEPIFPKRRHANTDRSSPARAKKPTETFKRAWEAATDAGEAPRHVWDPPNRRFARPEHSFRAAFQAFLTEQRVAGDVIDFLVGHSDGSVRDVHYGRDLLKAARDAVELIPAVEWVGR